MAEHLNTVEIGERLTRRANWHFPLRVFKRAQRTLKRSLKKSPIAIWESSGSVYIDDKSENDL
jgi:hypothetical protein